jgi:mannose-1-phosphate guanylyltransferase
MSTAAPRLIPVIISGGAGTRLWPASREAHPKPLMTLPDGQSLLHKTYQRVHDLPGCAEIMTVTNRELFFQTRDVYDAAVGPQGPVPLYVLEPEARNTAAAIAAAALLISRRHGPAALMLVLPADHLIEPLSSFREAVAQAMAPALQGQIVTFGIVPTEPNTGYGYLDLALADERWPGVCSVRAFVEKPDQARAAQFLASGHYAWNSGMFCFSAQTMLDALAQHAAPTLQATRAALDSARHSALEPGDSWELSLDAFRQAPDISIDYAVMERAANVVAVRNAMRWNDVGSWSVLSELAPADAQGNRVVGDAVLHDTQDCYVQSDRLVATVGVQGLVIVDTEDALLVADRERVQDVRHVVKELKIREHEAVKFHRTVRRPWGSYTVLAEGDRFKVKRIVVRPGASLSLQMHAHRYEHWIVVAGVATVVNGDQTLTLNTNESTFIPAGQKHRLSNPAEADLVLIEVQCGGYLGEDDIVRFDDVYGLTRA